MRHPIWLLLILSTQDNALATEQRDGFGRFFTTVAERQQLDQRRQNLNQAPPQVPTNPRSSAKTPSTQGIVKRSDGKTTLWIEDHFIQRDQH